MPPRRPRLVADAMLGDVARWLRILGEDCLYVDPGWSDDDVLELAGAEGRIIVTRDVNLVERARARSLGVVGVPLLPPEDVLVVVYEDLGLVPDATLALTRCSHCNAPLDETGPAGAVEAAGATGQADVEKVLERHEAFWVCSDCRQVFWRGTHWKGIQTMRDRLVARLNREETGT